MAWPVLSLDATACLQRMSGDAEPKTWLPGWDFVAVLANNPVSRYSAVVPIVGYLILLSEDLRLFVSQERFGTLFDATESKLIAVYFGFAFVFFSNCLFLLFRDGYLKGRNMEQFLTDEFQKFNRTDLSIISKYNLEKLKIFGYYDDKTFIRSELGESLRGNNLEKEYAQLFQICSQVFWSNTAGPEEVSRWKNRSTNVFIFYFFHMNYSGPIKRMFILFFSGVGYGLLAWPSLDTFIAVVRFVFASWSPWPAA